MYFVGCCSEIRYLSAGLADWAGLSVSEVAVKPGPGVLKVEIDYSSFCNNKYKLKLRRCHLIMQQKYI